MHLRKKLFWIVVLYLSQGFPFGLITSQLPVYFRQHGLSLETIGLMTLVTLPWSLKIGWAPIVDRYGERKHWIVAMQVVLAGLAFLLPTLDPTQTSGLLWIVLIGMSFASATADIAIDAYSIEILDKSEIGPGNAARIMSWKLAYMASTGLIGTIATLVNWHVAFYAAAAIFLILIPLTLLAPKPLQETLPESAAPLSSPFSSEFWLAGYLGLLKRPGVLFVLFFVLTFKLGSSAIGPMIRPFWVDRGYTAAEIGLVTGTIGTAESFLAPIVAAFLIARLRLFHTLWIFGVLQVAPSVMYSAVSHFDLGRFPMYAASLTESFDLSLAQVAFTSFLMMVCEKKHAATQYAFLSCVFGFTRSVVGFLGSFGATQWGYSKFFLFTFFLGFVSFMFLPWVKRWIQIEERSKTAT